MLIHSICSARDDPEAAEVSSTDSVASLDGFTVEGSTSIRSAMASAAEFARAFTSLGFFRQAGGKWRFYGGGVKSLEGLWGLGGWRCLLAAARLQHQTLRTEMVGDWWPSAWCHPKRRGCLPVLPPNNIGIIRKHYIGRALYWRQWPCLGDLFFGRSKSWMDEWHMTLTCWPFGFCANVWPAWHDFRLVRAFLHKQSWKMSWPLRSIFSKRADDW